MRAICRQCESGVEAAESLDVMAEDDDLTAEQAAEADRLRREEPGPATERAVRALRDDR